MDLTNKVTYINQILERSLPKNTGEYGCITEAMRYSVLNGGKRLRAIMLLEAFRMFSDDTVIEHQLVEPFITAIECIHAYSLVHDDLPAMDNDTYRRGVLTTHAKFGHANGILAGDALLNYAFEIVSDAACSLKEPDDSQKLKILTGYTKAMKYLSTYPGYSGMIGGQVLDTTEMNSDKNSVDYLCRIYELKTSRLFQTALCCGAALGNATDEETEKLYKAAYHIGIAFQIRDDVLDMTSTLEEMGKEVHNDADKDKFTVPAIIGITEADLLVQKHSDMAIELIKAIDKDSSELLELVNLLVFRKK